MNPYYAQQMQGQNPFPMHSFCPLCPWENEKVRDERKFKELYPAFARKIQPLVEEACDRMEYDGSFMFDEYPDQFMIRRIVKRIYDKLDKSKYEEDGTMQELGGRNWIEDFVTMMLLNEMYQRRCRRRDRRCSWMFQKKNRREKGGSESVPEI